MKNLITAFKATFAGSASNSQMGFVFITIAPVIIIVIILFGHASKY